MVEFKKILVANRGEIACRVFRTLNRLQIRSVAVFSDADSGALHTRQADEAIALGGSEAKESYLSIPKIIAAVKQCGADAIHPGYGFLSENAEFVDELKKAGIGFIGPSAESMRALGDKIRSKVLAEKAKVPTVPGVMLDGGTPDALLSAIKKFTKQHGYPILIKASAGGGGRGMRVVREEAALEEALTSAAREAQAFFGDGRVFVERLIEKPRHIEVQLLGDLHGNVAQLWDRDCSMQRRHQKVIEEAPAPLLRDEVREKLHAAAIKLAKEAKYSNAGTAEFLLDQEQNFYFLEVNSRLQVEHPVTEEILGVDLVELQIRVAQGEKIETLLPNPISPSGHAIELRLCAEDPEHGFRPATGKLSTLTAPPEVRWESGVESGDKISHYYDPMIAKIIVHAPDRDEAILKARAAVRGLTLTGVTSNAEYLLDLLATPQFETMGHWTTFAEQHDSSAILSARRTAAALGYVLFNSPLGKFPALDAQAPTSVWGDLAFTYSPLSAPLTYRVQLDNDVHELSIRRDGAQLLLKVSETELPFAFRMRAEDTLGLNLGEKKYSIRKIVAPEGDYLCVDGLIKAAQFFFPALKAGKSAEQAFARDVKSPLPGKILAIKAAIGDSVAAGDILFVLESMKMEHALRAPSAGKIKTITAAVGALVEQSAVLAELEPLV